MDNDIPAFREGDQIQFFTGKPDPKTGITRQLMVIWRDNEVVWRGPLIDEICKDPRYPIRLFTVQLPMYLIRDFHTEESS